jgi:heat shock transcription factor 1
MHGLENSGLGVPAFLAKLWRLVEDPETNSLISWGLVSFFPCLKKKKLIKNGQFFFQKKKNFVPFIICFRNGHSKTHIIVMWCI